MVEVNDEYDSLYEAYLAGAHGHNQQGISRSKTTGRISVVVKGKYEDDEDYGSEILYTGEGGRDPNTGAQVKDQDLAFRGNALLAAAHASGEPIYIVRGENKKSNYAPAKGYRFDGEFVVDSLWEKTRPDGLKVILFRLLQVQTVDRPDSTEASVPQEEAKYVSITTTTRVRDLSISRKLKKMYEDSCQICDVGLMLFGGRRISEGAHIIPLGRPHVGPDSLSNLLCLCPNHHTLLDGGGIVISRELDVIDTTTNLQIGRLKVHPEHGVDPELLEIHRSMFPIAE